MSKLTVTTPAPNEIHMTREFDAPRRLVMKAMTTPELIKRWLGGVRAEVVSCEMDLRVGGRYRYVFKSHRDGHTFGMGGVIREIGEDRVIQTESFDGYPGEAIVTTTYVEHAGRTTMTLVITYPSEAVRDAVLQSGMATGAGESYDKLEELVASL
jgi:uncharacterized protein YndB with AHSA1/START domain